MVVPLTKKQSVERKGMDEVASKLTSLRNSVNLKPLGDGSCLNDDCCVSHYRFSFFDGDQAL